MTVVVVKMSDLVIWYERGLPKFNSHPLVLLLLKRESMGHNLRNLCF
jgi:hypothetical protein